MTNSKPTHKVTQRSWAHVQVGDLLCDPAWTDAHGEYLEVMAVQQLWADVKGWTAHIACCPLGADYRPTWRIYRSRDLVWVITPIKEAN